MSTELPPQQLLLQFCSAGHYLLFSSSAPFALPHFTTGNLKMPLPGLTEIPGWIISELPFRNNLHLDNGTKAAPTAIKSFAPSSPIMVAHLSPLLTLQCSQKWQRTFTLLGQNFFCPFTTWRLTLAHRAVIAVSILHAHLLQKLPIMTQRHKTIILNFFFFCKLAQINHCFMQTQQEDLFSSPAWKRRPTKAVPSSKSAGRINFYLSSCLRFSDEKEIPF